MDDKEFMAALNYFSNIRKYKLSLSVLEFETSSGVDNYSYFIKELIKNKSSMENISINPLEISRVYDLSSQILTLIFKESVKPQSIHSLYERVVVTGSTPFDGSVIEVDDKKFVSVGKNDAIESIPTLTHEGTHVIIPYSYTNNYHTIDTIPILTELIASIILDGMHIGENNFNKFLIARISSLRVEFLDLINTTPAPENKKEIYINHYKRHTFYNYAISFIYATNILINYLEEPSHFIDKLNESLMNDTNVYDLLHYYGVNFNSSKTIENSIKVLKNTP